MEIYYKAVFVLDSVGAKNGCSEFLSMLTDLLVYASQLFLMKEKVNNNSRKFNSHGWLSIISKSLTYMPSTATVIC